MLLMFYVRCPPPPWFMTCGGYLILIDSLTFEAPIPLPVKYICPFPIDGIVSLSDMISHCAFVKTGFRRLSLWPGVYLWYISDSFLMFTKSRIEFSVRFTCAFQFTIVTRDLAGYVVLVFGLMWWSILMNLFSELIQCLQRTVFHEMAPFVL